MKIALSYPKIPNSEGYLPKKCVAFEKLDGTNMHFVWNRAQHTQSGNGWVRFGTRRDTYSVVDSGQAEFWKEHKGLEGAFPAFEQALKTKLERNLLGTDPDFQEAVCYTEYRGPNSFAGQHLPEDIKTHTIIDIQLEAKFLSPGEFGLGACGGSILDGLPIPKTVYRGKFTGQFVEDVRKGVYPVNEGVVCKGYDGEVLLMCKVKTLAYQEKLKSAFRDNWKGYWE